MGEISAHFLRVTAIDLTSLHVQCKRHITIGMSEQLAFLFNQPAAPSSLAPDLRKRARPQSAAASRTKTSRPECETSKQKSRRQTGRERHPRRKRPSFGRYPTRRRPVPLPKPFIGYGAFRLVMRGLAAHVIGPDGKPCAALTDWARETLKRPDDLTGLPGARAAKPSHDPFAETRRIIAARDGIRMLLDALNWVYPQYPSVLTDLLDPSPTKAREVIIFWLKMVGCTLKKGRGRSGGQIVIPASAADQWRVSVTLTKLRELFDFWKDSGIRDGQNPRQMDPDRSRLGGDKRRVKASKNRWWLDVDSMFRVRHVDNQAPCPEDQAIAAKVLERGRQLGWSEEVYLLHEGQLLLGSRRGQLSVATAYGLLVAAKSENHLALPQKGSGGDLEWHARTPPQWRKAVLRMLAKRVDGGMAELMRLARSKSPADLSRLRKLYIFSPDGVAPTPRWKLDHCLRTAVDSLDLRYEVTRDDGSVVTRWFTSQWFRHIFVGSMLDKISASTLDAAGRDAARDKLGKYLKWKHPEHMLNYYGRRHFDREVDELVSEHQDDLNAQVRSILDDADPWLEPANDNSLWASGRVVGSDLLD